jgi:hypothetical protein
MVAKFGLIALLGVSAVAQAADPVPPQVPYADGRNRSLEPMRFEAKPLWVQRLDYVARHGWAMARLRRGERSDLVLGAHPDGYVGVFTTRALGNSRGSGRR